MGKEELMKRFLLILVVLLLAAPGLFAGTIHGRIYKSGRPIGKGVRVEIKPEKSDEVKHGLTDKFGRFSIHVIKIGKCTLVLPGKIPLETTVYSQKDPNQCDLVIYMGSDKKWHLGRK
jgi:hypothetical protein